MTVVSVLLTVVLVLAVLMVLTVVLVLTVALTVTDIYRWIAVPNSFTVLCSSFT